MAADSCFALTALTASLLCACVGVDATHVCTVFRGSGDRWCGSWTRSMGEDEEDEKKEGRRENSFPSCCPPTCTSKIPGTPGPLSCCCGPLIKLIKTELMKTSYDSPTANSTGYCFSSALKCNWRPFVRSWPLCNASVGQVVCACGCSVANSSEQPGRRAPRSIDRTLSHRRRMEIGPGGVAKEVHTCLHLLWTHMDAGISTHVHTERTWRVCVRVCVCVCVCTRAHVYRLPWMLTARWTEDDLLILWQYGAYRGGRPARRAFLSLCCRKLLDLFHLPSCPQLVLSAVGGKPHIHSVWKPGRRASSLLHYHMNGCHIAIYCMAIVGKSLKVVGSYMGS